MNRDKIYIRLNVFHTDKDKQLQAFGNVKALIGDTGASYGTVLSRLKKDGFYCWANYTFYKLTVNKK